METFDTTKYTSWLHKITGYFSKTVYSKDLHLYLIFFLFQILLRRTTFKNDSFIKESNKLFLILNGQLSDKLECFFIKII